MIENNDTGEFNDQDQGKLDEHLVFRSLLIFVPVSTEDIANEKGETGELIARSYIRGPKQDYNNGVQRRP